MQEWNTKQKHELLGLSDGNEDNTEELSFLYRFINCVEEGSYTNIDRDTLKIVEGKNLYIVLLYKLNHENFHSYEHLFIFEVNIFLPIYTIHQGWELKSYRIL